MAPTGRMPSVDASRFSMVPRTDVPRSAFDVRHTHKTTFDAGKIVPVYVDEVLPGDSFRLKMSAFARLSTPLVPVMDNLVLESFFFFVPNRLLWDNWARFMGEQASPSDTTSFLLPYVTVASTEHEIGDLADYFGITNNGTANSINVNAMPFRAYNMIYNEWFRHQDLSAVAVESKGDGPDTIVGSGYTVRTRTKKRDYFTSALPWPAKPIYMSSIPGALEPVAPGRGFYHAAQPNIGAPVSGLGVLAAATPTATPAATLATGGRAETWDPHWNTTDDAFYMKADTATSYPDVRVLIHDIRMANVLQVMMERNARGGTRYAELVRSHFGVTNPDSRLQRPEYLGGGRSAITVNPIAQTSATSDTGESTTVLGEQAGIASVAVTNHGFSQSFTEHGVILGLVSVRADLTYQQGLERMWLRRTQFDFYWPALANLPEQPILNAEIYSVGGGASFSDTSVFGYQERWSEYKYKPSRTSGAFRSTVAQPLDMWHYGQLFGALPSLNSAFIDEDPPMSRVLQVDTNYGEQILMDSMFEVRMTRCMPMFSIPGIGGGL